MSKAYKKLNKSLKRLMLQWTETDGVRHVELKGAVDYKAIESLRNICTGEIVPYLHLAKRSPSARVTIEVAETVITITVKNKRKVISNVLITASSWTHTTYDEAHTLI